MSHKKKKAEKSFAGIVFLMLIGVGILVYPAVSNLWNRYRNSRLVMDYARQINQITDDEKREMYARAVAYNRAHTVNTNLTEKKDPVEHKNYMEQLSGGIDGKVMGTLIVPRLQQQLVIYHSLSDEALENGCGHMEGSSLPVGGESTHAVLAAHRGLPKAKLFTDLDKMKIGDRFYIRVLGKRLGYRVDQIKVVLPRDVKNLQIEEGKDYVTLLTCTPYGVNTHRLLVRGERVPCTRTQVQRATERVEKDLTLQIVLTGCVAAGGILLLTVWIGRKKKRKERKIYEKKS